MDATTRKQLADHAWQSAITNNFRHLSESFGHACVELGIGARDRAMALALYLDIWTAASDAQSEGDWD